MNESVTCYKVGNGSVDGLGSVCVDGVLDVWVVAQPAEEARPHSLGIAYDERECVAVATIIRQLSERKGLFAACVGVTRLFQVWYRAHSQANSLAHIRTHVHTHIHIFTRIHTHTHTHTHTYKDRIAHT